MLKRASVALLAVVATAVGSTLTASAADDLDAILSGSKPATTTSTGAQASTGTSAPAAVAPSTAPSSGIPVATTSAPAGMEAVSNVSGTIPTGVPSGATAPQVVDIDVMNGVWTQAIADTDTIVQLSVAAETPLEKLFGVSYQNDQGATTDVAPGSILTHFDVSTVNKATGEELTAKSGKLKTVKPTDTVRVKLAPGSKIANKQLTFTAFAGVTPVKYSKLDMALGMERDIGFYKVVGTAPVAPVATAAEVSATGEVENSVVAQNETGIEDHPALVLLAVLAMLGLAVGLDKKKASA